MAAQLISLDEERKDAGRRVLAMLDDLGFGAQGAAWVYEREADHWWFLLISPMIDSRGPSWVYSRFLQVFRKLPLPPGITPLDIRVASPREQAFAELPRVINTPRAMAHVATLKDLTVGTLAIDAMFIYRMLKPDEQGGDRARAFEGKVRALLAA